MFPHTNSSYPGFEPEQNETEYLKRRLREEKAKAAKAERARRDAEERCLVAERERAVYRLLARRWQSRLNSLLSQQDRQDEQSRQQDEAEEGLSNLLELAGVRNNNLAGNLDNRSNLTGLRLMLQQISGDGHEEDDGDSDGEGDEAHDEHDVEEMEEDGAREDQHHVDEDEDLLELLADENESDSDDFVSVAEGDAAPGAMASMASGDTDIPDDNDSVMMEDADDTIMKGRRAVDQPRTISLSSDDL